MSVATKTQIKIYLLRHGKTPGNELGRYVGGRTDESLSQEGRAELTKAPEAFGVQEVFVSPMKRAKETAQILFPDVKLEEVEGLREIDFGEFENKNYKELSGNANYQAWIDSNGTLDFPQGEAKEAFTKRVLDSMKNILAVCREGELTSLALVAHGGTIMTVMSYLTKENYFDFQVKNAEGYLLTIDFAKDYENQTELEKQINVISYDRISCRISA